MQSATLTHTDLLNKIWNPEEPWLWMHRALSASEEKHFQSTLRRQCRLNVVCIDNEIYFQHHSLKYPYVIKGELTALVVILHQVFLVGVYGAVTTCLSSDVPKTSTYYFSGMGFAEDLDVIELTDFLRNANESLSRFL